MKVRVATPAVEMYMCRSFSVFSGLRGWPLYVSSASARRKLCNTMAKQLCTAKRDANEKTLFDCMFSSVDVNLKMGTPGEKLLSKSKEHMKKAAVHRLVGYLVRVV